MHSVVKTSDSLNSSEGPTPYRSLPHGKSTSKWVEHMAKHSQAQKEPQRDEVTMANR